MEKAEQKISMVYMGRRLTWDDKLAHQYQASDKKDFELYTKKLGQFGVGTKFSCERTGEGVKGGYKIMGFEKGDHIQQARTQDRLAYDEYKMVQQGKKGTEAYQYENAIHVLRDHYKSLSPQQRKYFKWQVLEDISKSKF